MSRKKVDNISLNSKGVTLIELLIVIVVMGIIAAFAIPSVGMIIKNLKEDVQVANMQNINNYINNQIIINQIEADSLFTYKRSGTADESFFSIFLEKTWEVTNGPGDADNTNVLNMTNSLSGKYGVVNWNDAPAIGDDLYCNQSLYITTDSDAEYEIGNPQTIDTCYSGSIVIWYDDKDADSIIIYFVDNEGMQTDMHFIYNKEDY